MIRYTILYAGRNFQINAWSRNIEFKQVVAFLRNLINFQPVITMKKII